MPITLQRLLSRVEGRSHAPTLDEFLNRRFAELNPAGEHTCGTLTRNYWADDVTIYATAAVLRLRVVVLEKRLHPVSRATVPYVLDTDTILKRQLATVNPYLYKDSRVPIVFLYRYQAGYVDKPVPDKMANHYAFAELVQPVSKQTALDMCVTMCRTPVDSVGSRDTPVGGVDED
eukprot:GHVU01037461.1.p2 GENE.GHVU01037461.1~~GHVU01037461.1.p2  ORF type:complete len:175 (+),score=24.96 GHVU01037461.1:713-1237(+)